MNALTRPFDLDVTPTFTAPRRTARFADPALLAVAAALLGELTLTVALVLSWTSGGAL